jgi:hypothetical protein
VLTLPTYVTRERLAGAMDVRANARRTDQLDAACHSGSRSVETLTRRLFWPVAASRSFDWPSQDLTQPAYRLWLDGDELVSLTSLTSGGNSIDAGTAILWPPDGPPYRRVDLDVSTSSMFTGASTWQDNVALTGVFGYDDVRADAGALAEDLDSSETLADVDGPAAAAVGVGDLLTVGTERMLVTDRTWTATGDSVTLSASKIDQTITGLTGYAAGELLLVGAERMRVTDVAGSSVIVERAVDGSVLADHTADAAYASRTLRVDRGYAGTDVAAHSTGAAVQRQVYPALVQELALGEALVSFQQQLGAYARPQGGGEAANTVASGTLADVRARAAAELKRYRDGAV